MAYLPWMTLLCYVSKLQPQGPPWQNHGSAAECSQRQIRDFPGVGVGVPGPERRVRNSIILQNFCRKLHENYRIWTKGASLAPPPWIRHWPLIIGYFHCLFFRTIFISEATDIPALELEYYVPCTLKPLLLWWYLSNCYVETTLTNTHETSNVSAEGCSHLQQAA